MKLPSVLCGLGLGRSRLCGNRWYERERVIVLHWNESIEYSAGSTFCVQFGLASCNDATTRANTTDTLVLHMLAAFPAGNSPRLAGLFFGIQYPESQIYVLDWGACGDRELHDTN